MVTKKSYWKGFKYSKRELKILKKQRRLKKKGKRIEGYQGFFTRFF